MQVFLHHTIRNLLLVAMALSATSCEWVKDDLPECPPTELRVGFKYDYHIFGGDVCQRTRGCRLCLYLFSNQNNKFLSSAAQRPRSGKMLGKHGYDRIQEVSMHRKRPGRSFGGFWKASSPSSSLPSSSLQ